MLPITQITAEEQEELIKKHLDERFKLTTIVDEKHKDHIMNRLVAYDLCSQSFQFWCNNFCWIQDPEAEDFKDKEIPFILYKYQEEAASHIIQAIEQGYDIPIEKTRKMGLSWLLMAILVWGWHFRQWDCLVGSQKAENVDKRGNAKSLLEKARYILYRMPRWIIPELKDKENDKNMLLINPKHGATLSGESNNTNFGRSDRRKVILFDEFSSWELTDKAAWQSCSSTTKCRIPLSTPNTRGVNCHYYTIVRDAYKKEKPLVRLHWILHPSFAKGLYYDDLGRPRSPWYDREVLRASSQQEVSQELDIDYEASMAGKVFPDFNIEKNVVEDLEYNEDLPLYCAWDFGLDATAILWIQYDVKKKLYYIIDEYQNDGKGAGTDIYHYLDIIDSKGYKSAIHYGDPHSGENRSLTSGTSNANILRKHGIIFKCQRIRIVERVKAGRNIITNIRVAESCSLAIEMFASWQLRRPKTGNTSSQVPEHSAHSHIGEAFTYFAFNHSNRLKERKVPVKKYAPSLSGVVY